MDDKEKKYDVYIDGTLAESGLSKKKAEGYKKNASLMLGGGDVEVDIKSSKGDKNK